MKITALNVRDIRFPTSAGAHGSDAMNPDPDYSCAYVTLSVDGSGVEGHGLTFTIGRGNELCVAAVESLAPLVIGREVAELQTVAFWRSLVGDSQLRWVGPEKGVIHLATAAIVNAAWDLVSKHAGMPLWQYVCEMSPEEIADLVDYRHITDALTRDEAVRILESLEPNRQERIAELKQIGYPSYTTSAGWLGYSDEKLRSACSELMERGWSHFKIKVGRDLEDDIRRCRVIREQIGSDSFLMIDANQVWDIPDAIDWINRLAEFDPWFVEEPTSPDDILGHASIAKAVWPIRVATGEMCHNRVMFKQFMQAGGMQVCQLDSCRLGGVNEVITVMLLAAKFGIPVCPHAGGVGLCEYVQHLSIIDYVCISGSLQNRITEYSDHLHEHFEYPVVMQNGRYMPPTAPGYSASMKPESLTTFEFTSKRPHS
ncbi:MAG: L-fuconate dehydratase [Planctomycetaceae bacterium]